MNNKTLDPVAINSDKNALLTVEQIRSRLNLTRSTAYKIANPEHGELPSIRIGKLLRVPLNALSDYIAAKLGETSLEELGEIEFFTVAQLTKYGFARSTLYGLVQSGKLRSVKFGSIIRIPAHWFDSFLQQHGYAPRSSGSGA
jgi:excisionase family DNA binding protein